MSGTLDVACSRTHVVRMPREIWSALVRFRQGCYDTGAFWYTRRDEQRRRQVFHGNVYYPSCDGLVGFAWLEKDSRDVHKQVCVFLRRALRGTASKKQDEVVQISYSNSQIMGRWQLAPHLWKLRVLRINMYQSWGRVPRDAMQPIAALFRVVALFMFGVYDSGIRPRRIARLQPSFKLCSHLGYVDLFEDARAIKYVGGEDVLRVLDGRLRLLFGFDEQHAELREWSQSLNVVEIRCQLFFKSF